MPWQFVLRLLCRTLLWAARSRWEGARRTQSALHHHFFYFSFDLTTTN